MNRSRSDCHLVCTTAIIVEYTQVGKKVIIIKF